MMMRQKMTFPSNLMNARQKGARGEREWRDQLREAGYTARRGQQFSGGSDSPDVICEELAGVIHFEVKRVQSLNIHAAVQQAIRDGKGKAPVVAHRKNGQEWLTTMPSWVFFALLRGGVEELHEMANEGWATPQSMGWVGSDGLP